MTESRHGRTGHIEFFFDPGCPWTWATSRSLVDAAPRRPPSVADAACASLAT